MNVLFRNNTLLWLKHVSYAGLLSLRAEYLYDFGVAATYFFCFITILWFLFSFNSKTWTIKSTVYSEHETIILKSLLFALLVLCYYLMMQFGCGSFLVTIWFYIVFSRLYRGNWTIFTFKSQSETYLTLKKLFIF